jgi:hypothetical protein
LKSACSVIAHAFKPRTGEHAQISAFSVIDSARPMGMALAPALCAGGSRLSPTAYHPPTTTGDLESSYHA